MQNPALNAPIDRTQAKALFNELARFLGTRDRRFQAVDEELLESGDEDSGDEDSGDEDSGDEEFDADITNIKIQFKFDNTVAARSQSLLIL